MTNPIFEVTLDLENLMINDILWSEFG